MNLTCFLIFFNVFKLKPKYIIIFYISLVISAYQHKYLLSMYYTYSGNYENALYFWNNIICCGYCKEFSKYNI